jgi:hypothetical protein
MVRPRTLTTAVIPRTAGTPNGRVLIGQPSRLLKPSLDRFQRRSVQQCSQPLRWRSFTQFIHHAIADYAAGIKAMPGRIALQKHCVRNPSRSLFRFTQARHGTSPSDWRTFGVRITSRRVCWFNTRIDSCRKIQCFLRRSAFSTSFA